MTENRDTPSPNTDQLGQENFTKDSRSKEIFTKNSNDLVFRLRKRAEIRRSIPTRKSVQENEPDRIADLLEEAANHIEVSIKVDKNAEIVCSGGQAEPVGDTSGNIQSLEVAETQQSATNYHETREKLHIRDAAAWLYVEKEFPTYSRMWDHLTVCFRAGAAWQAEYTRKSEAGVMGYPSEADERVKRLWAKLFLRVDK